MAAQEAAPVLVLGIDFGTTYSGIAWLRPGRNNQTKFITNWKKRRFTEGDKQKVPSAIFYKYLNDEDPAWGFTTPHDENVLRWFKLLLVDEKDLPEHIRNSVQLKTARALMLKVNKTPVQILGDYLRKLWGHCCQNIVKAEGQRMMKISVVNLVVTMPAIWPHYVRSRMTKALGHAGLLNVTRGGETTLSFISEPEAAALTCLKENADRFDVKVGDHFVICDAGGGTVDLITYKVEKLDPLIVSESVKGDESDWEGGIKADFCKSSEGLTVQLSYNGPVEGNFFPSEVGLDPSEIRKDVFDPVIDQVQGLVLKQVHQVKLRDTLPNIFQFVILVGGFGRSPYLYERLQMAVPGRVEVLQESGKGPWTAVLRGAVLHGLAQTNMTDSITVAVASRVSRHSYGTLVNILPFDSKEHDSKDRVWDEVHQEFLAVEQTEWFVEIGESIATYEPRCKTYWQDLTSPDQDIQLDLVTSDASTPPRRKDDSVKPLCIIKTSELPKWDTLPVWTNEDGLVFHRVNYELRMISDGTSLEFRVYYKNKSLASGSVVFDSTSQNDTEDEEDVQMGSPRLLNSNQIVDMNDAESDSDYVETEE
ncbi:heat shock 70 kDa 12B [Fusarium beomiforme]|uniref:Heat shock 70 kDa 12B n=1 Tax=Fusarium beomiforme TaxID=44412 RepID=A0A9P5DY22_9HYPO|nr:heat shock 70 kDa 12B [Fusarium beomiforme]